MSEYLMIGERREVVVVGRGVCCFVGRRDDR